MTYGVVRALQVIQNTQELSPEKAGDGVQVPPWPPCFQNLCEFCSSRGSILEGVLRARSYFREQSHFQ
jgi:hypothetical protein